MMAEVRFSIPAQREFVGLVRLAVGGLAPAMNFDAETIEDIKLAMSEVCTNLILESDQNGSMRLEFEVRIDDSQLVIDVTSPEGAGQLMSSTAASWEKPRQQNYGLAIISAVMDQVELIPTADRTILRLKKLV